MLAGDPPQYVIRVAARAGLIAKAAESAHGLCARVVGEADHRGACREQPVSAGLRRVRLAGDAVQRVIAVADGLRRRAGLVRCRRSLLETRGQTFLNTGDLAYPKFIE